MINRDVQVLSYLDELRSRAEHDAGTGQNELTNALSAAVVRFSAGGKSQQALLLAQELVDLQRRPSRHDRSGLERALLLLGGCLAEVSAHEEAMDVLYECVALSEESNDPRDDAEIALRSAALERLAHLLWDQGRLAEAIVLSERAVEGYEDLADSDPQTFTAALARSLYNLALSFLADRRGADALSALDRAIARYQTLAAKGDTSIANEYSRSLQARADLAVQLGLPASSAVDVNEAHLAYQLALETDAPGLTVGSSDVAGLIEFLPSDDLSTAESGTKAHLQDETQGAQLPMASFEADRMPLVDAVQAVRVQLEEAARSSGSLRFEVGPIELELTVELERDAKSAAGVRVFVVTSSAGERGVAAVAASGRERHRIKMTLTPRDEVSGSDIRI